MPCVPGCAPVASVAAFTRVTVGNTAWLFVNSTPSARRRQRVGVSSRVMASGRSPSTTNTMTNRASPRHRPTTIRYRRRAPPSSAVRRARKARPAADISRVFRCIAPMGRRNGPSAGGARHQRARPHLGDEGGRGQEREAQPRLDRALDGLDVVELHDVAHAHPVAAQQGVDEAAGGDVAVEADEGLPVEGGQRRARAARHRMAGRRARSPARRGPAARSRARGAARAPPRCRSPPRRRGRPRPPRWCAGTRAGR